jgi:hypothetical protein
LRSNVNECKPLPTRTFMVCIIMVEFVALSLSAVVWSCKVDPGGRRLRRRWQADERRARARRLRLGRAGARRWWLKAAGGGGDMAAGGGG